jgi:hypothetical protein
MEWNSFKIYLLRNSVILSGPSLRKTPKGISHLLKEIIFSILNRIQGYKPKKIPYRRKEKYHQYS